MWATYIGQIEKGVRVPSDDLCLQLAKALGLDPAGLLIAAYRERAQTDETRRLFVQMEKLLSDPVISRVVSERGLLDASLLEALEHREVRAALKEKRWREALMDGLKMADRDIPQLIRIVKQMSPQQWEALLNAAKAMAGVT